MTRPRGSSGLALVLMVADDRREQACERLSREGYDVVGFADCGYAAAWLDEETPSLAVIDVAPSPACADIRATLDRRGVRRPEFASAALDA